jgi:predicted secreted hydrolase
MRGWLQFDPAKDLRPHHDADGDSYYVVSYVRDDGGRRFTILFHVLLVYQQASLAQIAVSILDEDANDYLSRASCYALGEISLAAVTASDDTKLYVGTPAGSVKGPMGEGRIEARLDATLNDITVQATGPEQECRVEMSMKPHGNILPNLVTGVIPFAGGINYEFALPQMITSGVLVFRNNRYQVTGTSWFDREWGRFGPYKWTWMAIQLDDVQISLWDQQASDNPATFAGGERAFATLLHPTGSVAVASVTVTEEGDPFVSPDSHQQYARCWSISIPSQEMQLKLELRPEHQEIIPDQERITREILTARIEGKATVQGRYQGKAVQGNAFVEMFNLFPLFAAGLRPHPPQLAPPPRLQPTYR